MTDTKSLHKLATAIEAGESIAWGHPDYPARKGLGEMWGDGMNAYCGDLSAAMALHEAMLPEWTWEIGFRGTACVYPPGDLVQAGLRPVAVKLDDPARAWLLAILRALIAWETLE